MLNINSLKKVDLAIKIAAAGWAYNQVYSNIYPDVPHGSVRASKELSDEVNYQAQKMGIKHPVTVYTSNETNCASGVNGPGKWNSMSVTITPGTANTPFVISHELAHLKNNDPLITNLIYMTGICMYFLNTPIVVPALFIWATRLTYGRYSEKRADITAAKHSKNAEIASEIRFFSNQRTQGLEYRNTPEEDVRSEIIKKLKYSSTGDHLFTSDFPFFDTHPSHSSRIDYLTKLIEQRKEQDPIIGFAYQTVENGPLIDIALTREQSELLRKIVQNSSKKDAFISLEKIVLLAGETKGNVRLFHYGYSVPAPYNFAPEDIKKPQLLPAILETIMHSPIRENKLVEFSDASDASAINADYMLRCNKILEEDQLSAINTSTFGDPKQCLVVYSNKQLSLTSDKCFEQSATTTSDINPTYYKR